MAKDVVRLINHLDLERVALLGHSLGGRVAMLAALRFPNRISSLVVADMAPVNYRSSSKSAMFVVPCPRIAPACPSLFVVHCRPNCPFLHFFGGSPSVAWGDAVFVVRFVAIDHAAPHRYLRPGHFAKSVMVIWFADLRWVRDRLGCVAVHDFCCRPSRRVPFIARFPAVVALRICSFLGLSRRMDWGGSFGALMTPNWPPQGR